MKILRVMFEKDGVRTEFDGVWAPKWKTAGRLIVQMRMNKFGAMRATNPRLYNQITRNSGRYSMLHAESDLYNDAGWQDRFNFESYRFCKTNDTDAVRLLMAYHNNDLNGISANDNMTQMDSMEELTTGVYFENEEAVFKLQRSTHLTFHLSTFKNCHLSGDLHRMRFYGCNMEHSSFKDALVWDTSDLDGCTTTWRNCHMFGTKYFAYRDVDQSTKDYVLKKLTYDAVFMEHDGYTSQKFVASDSFMKSKGKTNVVERKIIDPEKFIANKSYLAEPEYTPTPGTGMGEYESNSKLNSNTFVSFNRNYVPKHKLSVCPITKLLAVTSNMSCVWLEQETARLWDALDIEVPFTSIDRSPYSRTHRNAGRIFGTTKQVYVHYLLNHVFNTCAISGLFIDPSLASSDGRHLVYNLLASVARVQQYSYRPAPVYRRGVNEGESSNLLHFGFELEVEFGKKRAHLTEEEKTLVSSEDESFFNNDIEKIVDGDFMYCKHDGSLGYGFEIVTHPFTWEWWRQNRDGKIKDTLEMLRSRGYISHDSGRCGLHVHMSKVAFQKGKLYGPDGRVKYEGNTHLMRFCAMIYKNPKFMVWLSRRDKADPQYAKISSWKEGRAGNDLLKRVAMTGQGPGHGNKYEAVNTMPTHTNEVRIFRGTLNFKSFCSSIELCHALWAYSAVPTNPILDGDNQSPIMGFVKWVHKSLYYDANKKRQYVYPHLSELFKAREDELKQVLDNKTNVFADDDWKTPAKKAKKLAKEAV